jgi:dihydroorotate dehydrogenase
MLPKVAGTFSYNSTGSRASPHPGWMAGPGKAMVAGSIPETKRMLDLGAAALRRLPPETAHRATLALTALAAPFIAPARPDDERLAISVFGKRFANPLGLAAGFDKDAAVPDAMLKLGFGFVECGTITPRPQAGNPRPRLFRLAKDRAVINRMGFNNAGMKAATERLARRTPQERFGGIVGINIGANKDSADRIADYGTAFAALSPHADYIAMNVSSPNTPGLRGLQNPGELRRLIQTVVFKRSDMRINVPVLLKLSPDIDESAMDDIAKVVLDSDLDGLILTNTTVERPAALKSAHAKETGGLSGAPLLAGSTEMLAKMHARVGAKLPLIGVGGVSSGADAYAKIRAGASLVQLYTALAFEGPSLIGRIKSELLALLVRDGFANIAAAVGTDINK